MKMFKLLVGFSILLFFACVKENDIGVDELNKKDELAGHVIPVEQVLNHLNQIVAPLKEKTRAADEFEIKNVEVVVCDGETRSSMAIDTLLYIVNFTNNKGYALLSADDRVEGLIAIIDKGNLTAREFKDFGLADGTDNPSIAHYLFSNTVNYLT